MRILFITHYSDMYGANMALYKLIKELKSSSEHEPLLLIPGESDMTKAMDEIGVKYYVSPITSWCAVNSTPLRFFIKKCLRKPHIGREVNNLYDKLKSENIDVIHSNSSVIAHGAMLAKKLGCRHIWHIREFSIEHFNNRYFYSDSFVRNQFESADTVVAISDAIRDNYLGKYPGANVIRIYDGVSPEYEDSDNRTKKQLEITTFVYAGYLFPMKKQDEVVDACAILQSKGYTNFELLLAGSGKADYEDLLKSKIEAGGLSDNVKLLGYVKDINKLFCQADVGIIASRYEGFGLVTAEYMLRGKPVIGYNHSGTAEIVVDGVTGKLYNSVEKLAEYMKQMMDDPVMRKTYGENGRARVLEHFTDKLNAKNIMKLYE